MENGKNIKPSYYSVVPAEVRYCKALGNASPRDLYGEIAALCNKAGYCFATNGYFATLYETEIRTIQRWLALLEKEGFIYLDKKTPRRKIFLAHISKFDPKGLREPVEPETQEEDDLKLCNACNTMKHIAKGKVCDGCKQEAKKFTQEDLYLAEMLRSKILLNFPNLANEKIEIQKWADEIRKLRTLNNKGERLEPEKEVTGYQIEFMISWVHGGKVQPPNVNKAPFSFEPHDFWAKNILSATKLRKQWYTALVPQAQTALKEKAKKGGAADLRSFAGKEPIRTAQRAGKL